MPDTTDEQLVAALAAGDRESLGPLMVRWEQPLFRFVYRMLPRTEDAADVVQDTFLRVLDKAHRFRPGSRFSTWMYQIALNLCRDRIRRRRRWNLIMADRHELNDEALPSTDEGLPDPFASASRREAAAALARALRTLPPEQREVLVLKEFEGLKFREIAEVLDCPESTVKSRLYYGLNGLRGALEKCGFDGIR